MSNPNSDKERGSTQPAEQTYLQQDQQFQDSQKRPNKLRTACDTCHSSKIRCCGGTPCKTCSRLQIPCVRSTSRRQGRPKGIRNKKSSEKGSGNSKGTDLPDDTKLSSLSSTFYDATTADLTGLFSSDADPFWDFYSPQSPEGLGVVSGAASPRALPGFNDVLMDTSQDVFQSLEIWEANKGKAQLQQQQQQQHNDFLNHDPIHHSDLEVLEMQDHVPRASCNCLQWLAKLLTNLKTVALDISSSQQTDAVLLCTRKASDVWKRMLQCAPCHENNTEEVLYLSISGIRIALRNLDTLFNQHDADSDGSLIANTASTADNNEAGDASDSCPEDFLTSTIDQMLSGSLQLHNHHISASSGMTSLLLPAGMADDVNGDGSRRRHSTTTLILDRKRSSSLGNFQTDSEYQQVVATIIAVRLVRTIQEILHLLKERLQSQGVMPSSLPEPSFEPWNSANVGLFTEDAGLHFGTAFGESILHLQSLLEATSRTSDILLHRLRNMSIEHLRRL